MTSGGSKPPFAWSQVNDNGFSKNDNEEVLSSAFYGGKLYIGTFNGLGCEVWRYEGNGWTQVASGGFGDSYNSDALSMAVADGYLYVGTNDSNDPCRVWRYDGPGPGDWTAVSEDGFGVKTNHRVHQLEVYKGALYAGAWNAQMTGCEVWTTRAGNSNPLFGGRAPSAFRAGTGGDS
ncbi:MAG: hypothetical protein MUQ00_05220 [Candidatus Aminicenantes bacterium]|jgi:hypothetical protein|nr:hypothetical protein [Candidatus Aminicenantes bacterium]